MTPEERQKRILQSFDRIQKLLEELPSLIALKIQEELEKSNQFGQIIDEVDINNDSKKN